MTRDWWAPLFCWAPQDFYGGPTLWWTLPQRVSIACSGDIEEWNGFQDNLAGRPMTRAVPVVEQTGTGGEVGSH